MAEAVPESSPSDEELEACFTYRPNGNTQYEYRRAWRRFGVWTGTPDDPEDETIHLKALRAIIAQSHAEAENLVADYVAHRQSQGLAPATINLAISALRSVVRHASRLGFVDWLLATAPIPSRKYANVQGTTTQAYTELLSRIVGHIESAGGASRVARRDLAMVRLLRDSGMRPFELHSLNREHFDAAARTVLAPRQAIATRSRVPLTPATVEAVNRWLDVRTDGYDALFINLDRAKQNEGDGRRLSRRGIYDAVVRWAATIHITPRMLRNSGVWRACELCEDYTKVAHWARLESPVAVQCIADRQAAATEVSQLMG